MRRCLSASTARLCPMSVHLGGSGLKTPIDCICILLVGSLTMDMSPFQAQCLRASRNTCSADAVARCWCHSRPRLLKSTPTAVLCSRPSNTNSTWLREHRKTLVPARCARSCGAPRHPARWCARRLPHAHALSRMHLRSSLHRQRSHPRCQARLVLSHE